MGNYLNTITPYTSLNAVTANGSGVAVDLGSAYSNFSYQVTTTGSPTAGTVTLYVSVDGTSYLASASSVAVGATPTGGTLSNAAWRYVRLDLTNLGGGTSPSVTAKLMAT